MQTIDAIWAKRTAERLSAQGLPAEELLKKAGTKRYLLNQKARKTEGPHWNERLGHGIIDVEATLAALP